MLCALWLAARLRNIVALCGHWPYGASVYICPNAARILTAIAFLNSRRPRRASFEGLIAGRAEASTPETATAKALANDPCHLSHEY